MTSFGIALPSRQSNRENSVPYRSFWIGLNILWLNRPAPAPAVSSCFELVQAQALADRPRSRYRLFAGDARAAVVGRPRFFFDMPAQNGVHYVTRSFGARPAVGQTHMMGSLLPLTPVAFLRSMASRAFRSCATRS
jgi:hypothetical protein